MERVHVLVEGQSEETFVGRTLQPHLRGHGVHITPILVATRRVVAGPDHKGGLTSWAKAKRDLLRLLGDSGAVAITTLVDYYGLPADVPGLLNLPASGSALDLVAHVEHEMAADIGNDRFRPYLALHEFEALLYTDPQECGDYLQCSELTRAMARALADCGEPEMVNDSPQTAPSKRIFAAFSEYRKTSDGPLLAARIGLVKIRAACPHFNGWLTWLESLGT